jgi:hypothetical protein
MKRFCFPDNVYKVTDEGILLEKTTRTIYKCDVCSQDIFWNDEWDDEKKAEVQAKIDAHDHITEPTVQYLP